MGLINIHKNYEKAKTFGDLKVGDTIYFIYYNDYYKHKLENYSGPIISIKGSKYIFQDSSHFNCQIDFYYISKIDTIIYGSSDMNSSKYVIKENNEYWFYATSFNEMKKIIKDILNKDLKLKNGA